MPELPEVETIRLGLQKFVVGHTIKSIELRLPKQFRGDPSLAIGGKIAGVRRYGKGLVIDLDNGYSLAVHVKMTGQLLYLSKASPIIQGPAPTFLPASARSSEASFNELRASGNPSSRVTLHLFGKLPDKYTHVVFTLDNDAVLYYRDMRQFGWIHVLPTSEVGELPFFKRLGKEPLRDLTFQDFQATIQKYRTPIKLLIMDQTKIAGVGNIYANDALYLARIHPKRPAASLNAKEQKALFDAIEQVLRKGIEVGGASEWHYVDVLGGKGHYQNFFQVYRKNGTPCPLCGTIIEKISLGGRGTFFCPACQR